MTKPHVNLIIATPGHSLLNSYVKSLLNAVHVLASKGISYAYTNNYASHVGDAREVTLSGTMVNQLDNSQPLSGEVTYDKILWIDSDIAFTPDDLLKLYESDKEIISGAYLFGDGSVAAYKTFGKNGYTHKDVIDMKETTEIEGCGFGFLMVKQGIFEQLSRPWFQQVMGSVELDGKTIEFPIMGEDLSWCKRVRDLGYKIYLDPSVKVTHHKQVRLTWEGIQP